MAAVELTIVDAASVPAQRAMGEYFAELATRFPDGFDAGGALNDASSMFNPPSGLFVLASLEGAIVGCGAIRFLDDNTGEIKRMWVSPAARGAGVGRRLLHELETLIANTGRRCAVLDTNASLTEAIAMYTSRGYQSIPPYNNNAYAELWFEKTLP